MSYRQIQDFEFGAVHERNRVLQPIASAPAKHDEVVVSGDKGMLHGEVVLEELGHIGVQITSQILIESVLHLRSLSFEHGRVGGHVSGDHFGLAEVVLHHGDEIAQVGLQLDVVQVAVFGLQLDVVQRSVVAAMRLVEFITALEVVAVHEGRVYRDAF